MISNDPPRPDELASLASERTIIIAAPDAIALREPDDVVKKHAFFRAQAVESYGAATSLSAATESRQA